MFVGVIFLVLYIRSEYKKVVMLHETVLLRSLSDRTVSSNSNVALAVGESAVFGGLRISFDGMIQDNRCPVDVVCIQGGAVTARVTMSSAGKVEGRNFPSDEVPYRFGDYAISIIRVAPDRYSTFEVNPKDYIIVFHIVKV